MTTYKFFIIAVIFQSCSSQPFKETNSSVIGKKYTYYKSEDYHATLEFLDSVHFHYKAEYPMYRKYSKGRYKFNKNSIFLYSDTSKIFDSNWISFNKNQVLLKDNKLVFNENIFQIDNKKD